MIRFPGLLLAHQPRIEGEDIGGEKKTKKLQVRKHNTNSRKDIMVNLNIGGEKKTKKLQVRKHDKNIRKLNTI